MRECRQVRGRVIESAVALLNQRGTAFELRNVFEENSDCAFALPRDSFFD